MLIPRVHREMQWEAALYAMGDRMGSYRKKNDTEKLKQSLVYFVRKKKKGVERKRIAVLHFHSWSPTGLPLQYLMSLRTIND